MCGIAGAFRVTGDASPPLAEHVLRRMTDLIAYRGPDDAGYISTDGCSLGARRLSIIDVEGGHQPFANEDERVWAAQNGEIYNHVALREGLRARGHVLRSRCDTEVLPHLYEEHGPALAERLRGMFAVAVWDAERARGVLIRDRLGVKPLYWARRDGVVVFGSELKCIIASGLVERELDHEAIAAYLTLGFVPSPLTPIAGVHKLNPGERLIVDDGEVRTETYWEYPAPDPEPNRRSAGEWAQIVRDALDDSIRMRLMSDVPLGAMLSGGLDSSLIVALMARQMERPVKTFAVGFSGEDSELPDARRVAQHCGADHSELEVSLTSTTGDLEPLVWHLDEPLADLSSLGFLALSRLAAQTVTVALSGQGADELFGGYRKHRVASAAAQWHRMPRPLRSVVAAALARGPGRAARLACALAAPDPVARLVASANLVQPELRAGLFSGALAEHADAASAIVHGHHQRIAPAGPLESALYLDARLGLVDDMLTYFDRASMACSLEVRVPFLDHEFVELAARIPGNMKVRRLEGKHVLRLAAKGLVPDFVLGKRKRGFFNEAVAPWLRAEGGAIVSEVLQGAEPAYVQSIDRASVDEAVVAWRAGDDRHAPLLLALVMLELWLDGYVDRAFRVADEEPSGNLK